MIPNLVRVSVLSPEICPGEPSESLRGIRAAVRGALSLSPDMIILPPFVLCGLSAGHMAKNGAIRAAAEETLSLLAEESAGSGALVVLSTPAPFTGEPERIVLYKGDILRAAPGDSGRFQYGAVAFRVWQGDPLAVPLLAGEPDCDLFLCLSDVPAPCGAPERFFRAAESYSESTGCAVVLCGSARGESLAPRCFRPFAAIYENGMLLARSDEDHPHITADTDLDIIRAVKRVPTFLAQEEGARPLSEKNGILRDVPKDPFLPVDPAQRDAALREYFSLQVSALEGRMRAIGCRHLVLGVSGGIDSTLALLVCTKAMDRLGLPRSNILGVTMPGFGTTDRTYYNALKLIVGLGAQLREISISKSVMQHFEDIGHDPAVHDVTYENAQARERTQILLDIANAEHALVAGTGDLSEEALGFCTYGGDQLASFNLNSSIPKTLARRIVGLLAAEDDFAAERDILTDILDTPVSPELLPAAGAAPSQKTEEILGPYELHDFFLFYFVRYGLSPSKIYYYALNAFSGRYSPDMIKETLRVFLRRFTASQFKRSCAPDSSALGPVDLTPCGFRMPSDMRADALIRELDTIKIKG